MLVLAAVIVLLYLGSRHLAAAWHYERAALVLDHLELGHEPGPERLRDALSDLRLALDWQPSRRYHFAMARLLVAKARAAEPERGRPVLLEAIAQQRAGLALAPVAPLGWTRLGRYLMDADLPGEALDAVRQSTVQAPFAPEQMWWRLELWLLLNAHFKEGDYALFKGQLAYTFNDNPDRLAALADHYRLRPYVRMALLESAGVDVEHAQRTMNDGAAR
ncbi:MAG: hypothetical protein ACPGUC_00775 [Gammaproteobacteria bacterium]